MQSAYVGRGVNLAAATGGRWAFRTAEDLAFLLNREMADERKLSRAALETLAIIAYHQPVSRGRDRGYPRRGHLEGHARRAAAGRLGGAGRAARDAGPALSHSAPPPNSSTISASPRWPICPAVGDLQGGRAA
jgi:hypothetical protein